MVSREVCKRCGRESAIGFSVPDAIWNAAVQDRWNVLCVGCFTEIADALRLEWDAAIQFWPVSLVTHLVCAVTR